MYNNLAVLRQKAGISGGVGGLDTVYFTATLRDRDSLLKRCSVHRDRLTLGSSHLSELPL